MNVNTSSLSKRRACGFTLVELLVAVSIMLLMLKLLLPSLKGLMGGTDASMARSQLIGDLNSARTLALRNGSDVYVVFIPMASDIKNISIEPNYNVWPEVADYLRNGEGNFILAEQSISYAIYAKESQYSPYDWYTDWKRLPQGFYFGGKGLVDIWNSAGTADPNKRLSVPNLKKGHGRGVGNGRRIYLPYLRYNAKGELSSSDNSNRMAMRDFYLSIKEGGVLPPAKDVNGTYALEDSERDEPSVAANKKSVWLQVNGLSGRADALEEAPDSTQTYSVWVHALDEEPVDVANMIDDLRGLPDCSRGWVGLWGNKDPVSGNKIFIGPGRIRPPAYTNISREELIYLTTQMRGKSPGTVLQYRRNPN